MTREEAIEVIRTAVTQWDRYSLPDDVEQALTTLAPAVRYEPPSVEDHPNTDKLWVYLGNVWLQMTAQEFRNLTSEAKRIPWLPPTAIPEGGA